MQIIIHLYNIKKNKDELVRRLAQQGLLPLYYNADKNTSIDLMRTLYKGGIRIFEYTNRGENALENFKELIKIRNAGFVSWHWNN